MRHTPAIDEALDFMPIIDPDIRGQGIATQGIVPPRAPDERHGGGELDHAHVIQIAREPRCRRADAGVWGIPKVMVAKHEENRDLCSLAEGIKMPFELGASGDVTPNDEGVEPLRDEAPRPLVAREPFFFRQPIQVNVRSKPESHLAVSYTADRGTP